MKAYEKEFAMRLLNNTSISTQWEEEFINELQVECGYQYTAKMITMMKDMYTSKDQLRIFKETCSSEEIANVDFDVQLLTAGTWPTM